MTIYAVKQIETFVSLSISRSQMAFKKCGRKSCAGFPVPEDVM